MGWPFKRTPQGPPPGAEPDSRSGRWDGPPGGGGVAPQGPGDLMAGMLSAAGEGEQPAPQLVAVEVALGLGPGPMVDLQALHRELIASWAAQRQSGTPPQEVLQRYGSYKQQLRGLMRGGDLQGLAQLILPPWQGELGGVWVHLSDGVLAYLVSVCASLARSGALTAPPSAEQLHRVCTLAAVMAVHEGRGFGTPDYLRVSLQLLGPQLLSFSPALAQVGGSPQSALSAVLQQVAVPTA